MLPVIFLILFSLLSTETPAYLMRQGDEEMARAALERLRTNKDTIEREMVELQLIDKENVSGAFSELFR